MIHVDRIDILKLVVKEQVREEERACAGNRYIYLQRMRDRSVRRGESRV